ncbi:MAG: hypothetical protein RL299_1585 [Pseudomonadota bacterium]|jgi:hypothetical protein
MHWKIGLLAWLLILAVPALGAVPQDRAEAARIAREAADLCKGKGEDSPVRIGRAICLRGNIDIAKSDKFRALKPSSKDVLVASGPGGDIAAAMDIGDALYKHDMLVVIDDLCGSSCAYFLALGGRRLVILDSGLLGFHGGPIPKKDIMKIPNISNRDREKILSDNRRFANFFSRRKIDIGITNKVPESMNKKDANWKARMWVRWPDELGMFGFRGLVFCSGKYCEKPK